MTILACLSLASEPATMHLNLVHLGLKCRSPRAVDCGPLELYAVCTYPQNLRGVAPTVPRIVRQC